MSPFVVPDVLRAPNIRPVARDRLRSAIGHVRARLRRRQDGDATKTIRRRLSEIDFEARFDTPEKAVAAIRRYTIACSGENAVRELEALRDATRDADTVELLSGLLDRTGRTPEEIVKWVHRTTVHVSFEPSVMTDGPAQRPFNPLETLLSGIGQCTGFSILASALIEAAGYPTRLWTVHGHTYLEWRRPNGRWQMEDPDLLPPDVLLPRGLSVRSLLENYHEWRPLMASVPMHNSIEQMHCYAPTEHNLLIPWLVKGSATTSNESLLPGFVTRETRQLAVAQEMRDGVTKLGINNPNAAVAKICVSNAPFESKANPYATIKGQQDLLKFDTVHNDYLQHFLSSSSNLYILAPAGSTSIELPADMGQAKRVSVFTMSAAAARSQPYLIHGNIQASDLSSSVQDLREPPETLSIVRRAMRVFVDVCDRTEAEGSIAAKQARTLTPEIAADFMAKAGLPRMEGRVLDAGCGTGGFSFVLAEHADEVVAIDYTAERVDFLRAVLDRLDPRPAIEPVVGSVDRLPYPDGHFDAVFSRSVIFLTDLPRTLAEFHRVLKPGGQVYIDCNADAWNLYLMLERVLENPDAFRQGRDTLYNTAWRRHAGSALPILARSIAAQGLKLDPLAPGHDIDALLDEMDRHLSGMDQQDAATVRRLELQARHLCGEEHLPVILADILAAAAGKRTGPSVTVGSQAWQPEEVADLAAGIGFEGFEWWSEAGSREQAGLRPLEIGPQLETRTTSASGCSMTEAKSARRHFRGQLTVWNATFRKAGA